MGTEYMEEETEREMLIQLQQALGEFRTKASGLMLGIAVIILIQFALIVWLYIKIM